MPGLPAPATSCSVDGPRHSVSTPSIGPCASRKRGCRRARLMSGALIPPRALLGCQPAVFVGARRRVRTFLIKDAPHTIRAYRARKSTGLGGAVVPGGNVRTQGAAGDVAILVGARLGRRPLRGGLGL